MLKRYFLPLTAGGPGSGVGVRGESSSSGSRGRGGGGGARLGHWPISAFSKETGREKSERLRDGRVIRVKMKTIQGSYTVVQPQSVKKRQKSQFTRDK